MNLGPLFFQSAFNRGDGGYNKYAVVSKDTESYDLLENGNFIMNFLDLGKAIQYFKDEFDLDLSNEQHDFLTNFNSYGPDNIQPDSNVGEGSDDDL